MTLICLLITLVAFSLIFVNSEEESSENTRILENSNTSTTSISLPRVISGRVHLRFSKSSSLDQQSSSPQLVTGTALPSTATRIVLNGGEFTTLARYSDGYFSFPIIKPGIYLMEIFHPDYIFSTFKINVPSDSNAVIQTVEYKHPGAPKTPARYPFEIFPIRLQTPGNAPVYFDERPKIYIISMLMNPMVLVMLCMGLMGLYMKSIPEEEKLAMAEEQRKMGIDPNNPLSAISALMKGGPVDEVEDVKRTSGSTASLAARQRVAAAAAASRDR